MLHSMDQSVTGQCSVEMAEWIELVLVLQWVDKVKYLGVYIACSTAMTDVSSNVRQFYSRFNNVLSVIGKGSREMCTLGLHLTEV